MLHAEKISPNYDVVRDPLMFDRFSAIAYDHVSPIIASRYRVYSSLSATTATVGDEFGGGLECVVFSATKPQ